MSARRNSNARRTSKPTRINLGSPWTAVSLTFDEATVDNPHVSLEVRLLAAARLRLEHGGHSHWRRGELRGRLLIIGNDDTLRPVARTTLNAALQRLMAACIFQPGSTPECLRYSVFAVQTGHGQAVTRTCPSERKSS